MSRSRGLARLTVLALAFGGIVPSVRAQIVSRTIESEAERQRLGIERQTRPQRQSGPGVVAPAPGPRLEFPAGGTKILLTRIDFAPSHFLASADLDAIRARHVGREVDLAAIGAIVQSVNDLYAERGLITASAVLPPQKLDGGVLTIGLVEGRLGTVGLSGAVQTWPWYIRAQIPAGEGEVVDAPALNRSVSLFNRLNDLQVRAQLGPGASFGLTNLDFAITEPARNIVQLSFDNQGVISTGRYQGTLFWRHHNLLGIDDRLIVYGSRVRGSVLGSASYTLPVSPWGTRLGASFNRSAYRIVAGQIRELRPEGVSESASLTLSQPIFATDLVLLQATGSYGLGSGRSKQLDIATVDSRYRRLMAGAALTVSLPSLQHSSTANWASVTHENLTFGDKRDFVLMTGNTTTVWRITDDIYGSLVGAWQHSRDRQLPGDQIFQIGGPTTVRGYPVGAAFGHSGFYAQAELHYVLPEPLRQLEAFVFLDHGITYASVVAPARATAVGAGLIWRPLDWATLEGGFGHALERVSASQRDVELYVRLSLRKSL